MGITRFFNNPITGAVLGGMAAGRDRRRQTRETKRLESRDDAAIQRKVADARAAGVHPLFALGAATQHYVELMNIDPIVF